MRSHVENARLGPDIITQVENLTVRVRQRPRVCFNDSEWNDRGAKNIKVTIEQDRGQLVEGIAAQVSHGAELAGTLGRRDPPRLDLISASGAVFRIVTGRRVILTRPAEGAPSGEWQTKNVRGSPLDAK